MQTPSTSLVDTLRISIFELRWFLGFLLITLFSFSSAFHVLLRNDQKEKPYFRDFWRTFATVSVFSSNPDLDKLWGSQAAGPAILLALFYLFTTSTVLINCLIAALSDSYGRLKGREPLRLLKNRALAIDELEAILPSRVAGWYPKHLYFLKASGGKPQLTRSLAGSQIPEESGVEDRPDPKHSRTVGQVGEAMEGRVHEIVHESETRGMQALAGMEQRLLQAINHRHSESQT